MPQIKVELQLDNFLNAGKTFATELISFGFGGISTAVSVDSSYGGGYVRAQEFNVLRYYDDNSTLFYQFTATGRYIDTGRVIYVQGSGKTIMTKYRFEFEKLQVRSYSIFDDARHKPTEALLFSFGKSKMYQ